MAASRVRLDTAGIAEVLRSAKVSGEARRLANAVADVAQADGPVNRHSVDVEVDEYTARGGRLRSERPAFAVTLAHAAGMGIEAKHGTLTRAAQTVFGVPPESDDDLVDYVRKDGSKRSATRAQARNWSGGTQG